MLPYVNNVCKSAFYHLRTISRIKKYLSTQTTEILIHAFVTSKLDHCKLGLITRSWKCDHITPILFNLHWLSVSERIKFKIPLLTFKALHQQSQDLISNILISNTCRLDGFGHLLRSV